MAIDNMLLYYCLHSNAASAQLLMSTAITTLRFFSVVVDGDAIVSVRDPSSAFFSCTILISEFQNTTHVNTASTHHSQSRDARSQRCGLLPAPWRGCPHSHPLAWRRPSDLARPTPALDSTVCAWTGRPLCRRG